MSANKWSIFKTIFIGKTITVLIAGVAFGQTSPEEIDSIPIEMAEKSKELNIPIDVIPKVRKYEMYKRKAFNDLYKIYVAKDPKYVTFRAVKTIYLHPAFQVVLNFSNNYVVRYATTSTQMVKFSVNENSIIIQPPPDFTDGDITIILQDIKRNKKFVVNYILKKYTDSNLDGEPFYPVYQFMDKKLLDPYEVIDAYYKIKGEFPTGVKYIEIDNIGYKIIEVSDKIKGKNLPKVRINGKIYLVYAGTMK